VQGRRLDFIPLPDGRSLHPFHISYPLIKRGTGWLRQYQITQERLDRFVVRLVASPEPTPAQLAEVTSAIHDAVGRDAQIQLLLVPEIPLEPTGKLRLVRPFPAADAGGWSAAAAAAPRQGPNGSGD
jgi:hypothetical protein